MADNISAIHTALQFACSQNPSELKLGEKQLRVWEEQSGYYAGLASVFTDRNVESDVRLMAIICLYNGIDRHWRSRVVYKSPMFQSSPVKPVLLQTCTISEEEKTIVRNALLTCIEEPISKISAQLSVVIARIARIDCPNSWPELLPTLTEGVRSQSALLQRCSLLTLRDVIKSFASWRVVEQRRIFFEITGSLFAYVSQIWVTHLSSVEDLISHGQLDFVTDSLSLSCICLKLLQLMLLYGFSRFNADSDAVKNVEQFIQLAPKALELRSRLPVQHSSHKAAENVVTTIMKTLYKLQRNHPIGYVSFISSTFELVYSTIFNQDIRSKIYSRFLIYGLLLLKSIFICEDYIIPMSKGVSEIIPLPQVLEAHSLKIEFFKGKRLELVLEQLVTNFMILSQEELDKWQDSPEEYAAPEDATGKLYMFSNRASVEGAFLALVHELQLEAVPIITRLINSIEVTNVTSDVHSLLVKEAILNATGLAAFDLYEHFNFESWFHTHLINELSITDNRYRIVRRRIVWLIGNWVPIKFDPAYYPALYQTLLPILHPNEDLVTRLTAAESLRQVIDDVNFVVDSFSPFVPDTMQLLLKLLLDVNAFDTKLVVMKVFSQLIEQIGVAVRPHIGSLLEQIPVLWAEAGGENSSILQCAIIATLTIIVNSLGELSSQLHPFLLPIIQYSTDIKTDEHIYLAEDGLDLWFAAMSQTPHPTMEVIQLLQNMNGLLGLTTPTDDSTHSLEGLLDIESTSFVDCFDILDSYIVLCAGSGQELFLQHCAEIIVKACRVHVRAVRKEGVDSIVMVMDRLMVAYPAHGHQLLQPVILGLLKCVLNNEETDTPTYCLYLGILARAMLCNAQHFLSTLQLLSQEAQHEVNTLLGMILDIWSSKLDNIGDVRQRKLFGLAAASILSVDDPCVTERFGSLLDMCVEVLHDVTDSSTTGGQTDVFVLNGIEAYPEPHRLKPHPSMDSEHSKRVRQLQTIDPIWSVSLPQLVLQQLETCLTTRGIERYRALLMEVDIIIREQCVEFLPPERVKALLCFET